MHLRSWFKHPPRSYSWTTTIQLCLLRLFHITSVSGVWESRFAAAHVDESEGWPSSRFRCECCHSYGWRQNMHCSSSTDTRNVKQVLKTFNSAFMLLLIQKEQPHTFQPHIIIREGEMIRVHLKIHQSCRQCRGRSRDRSSSESRAPNVLCTP